MNLHRYQLISLLMLWLVIGGLGVPEQDLVIYDLHLDYKYKWYSGYLNFSESYYHYVFFDSQYDPANDPLILWLNGGPGCSSLIGMVNQNGPFVF